MFSVTITYIERELTPKETETWLRSKFGDSAIISLAPATTNAEDVVSFMLDFLVSDKQASAKFNNHTELYHDAIKDLKSNVLKTVGDRYDALVAANEERL